MLSTPCTASWGCTPAVARTASGLARATATARLDSSASVPMHTILVTPAAAASSTAPSPTPSYWTWQCESAQATRPLSRLAGEPRLALLHGQPTWVPAPRRRLRQALVGGGAGETEAPPDLRACRGHGRP